MKRSSIKGFSILATTVLVGGCAVGGFIFAPPTQGNPGGPAPAGEISGRVFFKGAKPHLARIMMDQDPVCAGDHQDPVYVQDGAVNTNGTLPNVFVYVKSGAEKSRFSVPQKPVILDQRGCVYVPHILGIMVGQELRIVSSDPTTHNVNILPKNNPNWNQSQLPGSAPLIKRFDHPEIMIPVKCNQHPWMKAYIGVTTNPFYAATAQDGMFTLKDLLPGNYTVEAWTATFGTLQQAVTVRPEESTVADFTFRMAP